MQSHACTLKQHMHTQASQKRRMRTQDARCACTHMHRHRSCTYRHVRRSRGWWRTCVRQVLPTPVGPVNRSVAIGRASARMPARARCTARATALTAPSCPTTRSPSTAPRPSTRSASPAVRTLFSALLIHLHNSLHTVSTCGHHYRQSEHSISCATEGSLLSRALLVSRAQHITANNVSIQYLN